MVTVKITNDYSDGHRSEREVVVRPPRSDHDVDNGYWWEEEVFPHTGDGHGADNDLGFCYTAEVIAADDEVLLGQTWEWVGS